MRRFLCYLSVIVVFQVVMLAVFTTVTDAHPGSGIVVDASGQVYFVDTAQGIWKLNSRGRLTLISRIAYHWMALDARGRFAKSQTLGNFDRGSFERITPFGATPALIISSDFPIAIGEDGGLYYVPYSPKGPREVVRRAPDGQRTVWGRLPPAPGEKSMRWVNGLATGPDQSLYVTDDVALYKIGRDGRVSTVRDGIQLGHCSDPPPETPKLPYLRGIAVGPDGIVYVAATGCRAVIAIPEKGPVRTVLRAESPWAPTAVAVSGQEIFVLEYLHTPGDNRKEWIPRVRKVGRDGRTSTLASVTPPAP
jgi:DNA-binding beta-propeller fold protein YncE